MGWSKILEGQKRYSFKAHLDFGKEVFNKTFSSLDKLQSKVISRVNEQRPKEELTEAQFLKKALNLADVDYQLKRIAKAYYKGLLKARDSYYKDTRAVLLEGFNQSAPSFIRLSGGPSEAEMGRLTTYTFGRPISQSINRGVLKMGWRLDDIVANSIRPISTNKLDYKSRFRQSVNGAFNNYKRFYTNLMRDLFVEVYVDLQDGFFRRLNG